MEDKKSKIGKMAGWTIAIFATIFAVAIVVLWLPIYPLSSGALSALARVFAVGWPILVLDTLLCSGVYFGYKFFLNRQK
jgi:hypothetical protein